MNEDDRRKALEAQDLEDAKTIEKNFDAKRNLDPKDVEDLDRQIREWTNRPPGKPSLNAYRKYNGHDFVELVSPDGETVIIDKLIAPLVQVMWRLGIRTAGSCQGNPVASGEEYQTTANVALESFEDVMKLDRAFEAPFNRSLAAHAHPWGLWTVSLCGGRDCGRGSYLEAFGGRFTLLPGNSFETNEPTLGIFLFLPQEGIEIALRILEASERGEGAPEDLVVAEGTEEFKKRRVAAGRRR